MINFEYSTKEPCRLTNFCLQVGPTTIFKNYSLLES